MSDFQHYVLWGSAGHAKVLADSIAMNGGRVVALFDNNPGSLSCLVGVPLFYGMAGFRNWLEGQDSLQSTFAALAIGGARGTDRYDLAQQLKAAGLSLPPVIHPDATVSVSAKLGEGCQVLARAVVASDVSMGSVSIVNNSANVDHECQLGTGVHIAPGAVLCGCVTVGDHAMVGAGAVVLPGLHIGRGAVVGAGAVVTRDVSDGMVVTGNPAKIMKSRK